VRVRFILPIGAVMAGLLLTGCGSGGGTTSVLNLPPPNTTDSTASTTAATCPTLAQAEAALNGAYRGPAQSSTRGGGIVCEYIATTAPPTNAEVTVFAHESPTVYYRQMAHGATVPGMTPVSGVGTVAYALSAAGRTIVNAFSTVRRTFVAVQSSAALSQTEALARFTLADN